MGGSERTERAGTHGGRRKVSSSRFGLLDALMEEVGDSSYTICCFF